MKTIGVHRFDVGGLEKPELTPAGFLRVDGYLTRAGIFTYRNADGTTRRELRDPDEVFKADSLNSFALAPVTDDHPPANLTAENAREYQRGAVTENLRQDGDHLRGRMLITDADLRDKMMSGKKAQVSCGYTCDVEMTPGEWRGQKYDAVQKNIRGNHVAIVERGRAGAGARVRMDAADAGMLSDPEVGAPPPTQEKNLKTFRLDGVSYECSEQVSELLEKLSKERKDALDGIAVVKADAQKRVDAAAAIADQAKSELEKAKADSAKLPETIRKEIGARMDLEQRARGFLGKAEKFDGKTDREVRVAVLKKLQPKADVAGKSDDYVAARFDVATESAKHDSSEDLERARKTTDGDRNDEDEREDDDKFDAAAAHERMKKANREMYKEPIGRQAAKS